MDRKELERRLDRLCSVFVRCREHRCYTCNAPLRFADREAGHYIPRVVKGCRWDLTNIHTQCHKCNVFKGGNIKRYHQLMVARDITSLERLDWKWELYRMGGLPEPTYETKTLQYNNLLDMIRERWPQQAKPFAEWQKL